MFRKHKVGKIICDRWFLFEAHEQQIPVFDGCIVLDREVDVYRDRITFTILRHDFREIDVGEIVPMYRVIVASEPGGKKHRVEFLPE